VRTRRADGTADNDGGKRLLDFGPGAFRRGHRDETERGDEGGHDHWAEARQGAFADGPPVIGAFVDQLAICVSITRPIRTATPDNAISPTARTFGAVWFGLPLRDAAYMPDVARAVSGILRADPGGGCYGAAARILRPSLLM
jgi:hypothetical protein